MLILVLALAPLPLVAQQSANQPSSDAVAKQIVLEIAAGEFARVEQRYTPDMSAALPAGRLAAAWASILEHVGSFDSIVSAAKTGRVQNFDTIVVVCKFQKALVDAQMALGDDGRLGSLRFGPHQQPEPPWTNPTYAKPDSFTEQPLVLVNGKFQLPGMLSVPAGNGPFPAVVLLHGSGPHDQDETVGPNKPLKDLAWGLASHGIIVFRYVKRTQKYGSQSSEDPAKLTVDEETISDARAAAVLLAKQKKVDPHRIFLIGHSLGAYLEPRIVVDDAQIAGIVMLAGNTRPMELILLDEVHYILASESSPTPDEQKQVAAIEGAVKKIESPDLKPGDSILLLGGAMPASYWLDLRDYHPVAVAQTLRIPILILQGGRDFQVSPATNFQDWKTALAARQNVTLKLYPSLNHLFMAGTGPSLPQEYEKPAHVDEQVIADISAWIATGGEAPHLGPTH
ncbi:MAG TPA: alpha/beta fold hydrolase [Candidatus Acidoferrales bacterium]|nr:alpha/beta fold hydrolase [Candidatus Acidoferrales bacterium]